MGLTKRQMVDLTMARVSGGLPSDDVSVHRAEVIRLIPPAINWATIADYRIERRMNRYDPSTEDRTADLSAFMATYTLDVEKDNARDLRYVLMSKGLLDIPGSRAIESIFPQGSTDFPFNRVRSAVELAGVHEAILANQTFYWVENVSNQTRIYFKGISHLVKEVIVRAAASASDIAMDDIMPVPDHIIMEALSVLVEWFTGQRALPEELVVNNKDDIQ